MKKPVNPAITIGIPKNRTENQWDETKREFCGTLLSCNFQKSIFLGFFSASICKEIKEVSPCNKYYRGWLGQPVVHFLKYQKTRQKIGQKTLGRVKFYAAACFTSYFISCFPIFQKWKTRGHAKFYAGAWYPTRPRV